MMHSGRCHEISADIRGSLRMDGAPMRFTVLLHKKKQTRHLNIRIRKPLLSLYTRVYDESWFYQNIKLVQKSEINRK